MYNYTKLNLVYVYITHIKHMGYFNHVLGCLSYIIVTKECYK